MNNTLYYQFTNCFGLNHCNYYENVQAEFNTDNFAAENHQVHIHATVAMRLTKIKLSLIIICYLNRKLH